MNSRANRRKDAHEKIQLGGLVVKAGLREMDKAVLLGILVFGASELEKEGVKDRFRAIGKAKFREDKNKRDASDSSGLPDDGDGSIT